MKRLKFIFLIILIAIIAGVSTFFIASNINNKLNIYLYFLNGSSNSLVLEKRSVPFDNTTLETKILEELQAGPKNSSLNGIIPEDVTWKINRNGTKINVDFSGKLLSDDKSKNMLIAYAVTKSLCQANSISSVKVTVNGNSISDTTGKIIEYLSDSDINLLTDSITGENKILKLYFAGEDGKLKAEWHTVKIADNVPIEKYIVSELIKGPSRYALSPVITKDTNIISAEVLDGITYINMGQGFIEKNSGTKQEELLTVYGIVNSICENTGCDKVKFLVDGKKTDGFYNVKLSDILYKRQDLIK